MTTAVVLAEPPVEGTTLAGLVGPLSETDAVALYRAMLADICETLQRGEADVLVNYPPTEQAPVDDPESRVRAVLDAELPEPDAVRYEQQVGESRAGRVGNALTHLLESEQEETVAAVAPTAPFLRREHVGTAAMKLRTNDVVLGPAPGGRVTFAGFGEPVDFADAYAPPAVETLARRASEADLDADFLPMTPVIERSGDLATALPVLAARQRSDRLVPPRTAAALDGWRVGEDGVVRESE